MDEYWQYRYKYEPNKVEPIVKEEFNEVDEKVKSDLLRLRDAIDIAELSKEIERITEELFLTYNKKLKRRNNYA